MKCLEEADMKHQLPMYQQENFIVNENSRQKQKNKKQINKKISNVPALSERYAI